MIIYRRTSSLDSPAQTLVNTVNCVGVMGKGLAKAHRDREPEMFREYKVICDKGLLEPGKLWLWKGKRNWVLNFPTKKHWRSPSKIEWIEAGLEKFRATYVEKGIREISFPKLGCGNGGLKWEDVKPLMEHYLSSVDIPVFIHDFTKDIGPLEHLESALPSNTASNSPPSSFEAFIEAIRRSTDLCGGRMTELGHVNRTFSAFIGDDADLTLSLNGERLVVDEEALRGIWFKFERGLVTEDQAGWMGSAGAKAVLSILSILPGARPIEIQRSANHPEIAIEVTTNRNAAESVPEADDQRTLSWA